MKDKVLTEKQRFRIADILQLAIRRYRHNRYRQLTERLKSLLQQTEGVAKLHRQLSACLDRDWTAAATRIARRLDRLFAEMSYHTSQANASYSSADVRVPAAGEIVAELRQLEDEFAVVSYDPKSKSLSVFTEAIRLEDVYLGQFEIQLFLQSACSLRHSDIYRVIALDPHPAASNSAVTHPHVSEEALCEGDAGAAMENALRGGRVSDFFTMVGSVLKTYNRESPYVALENWHGVPCYECGYVANEECYFCHFCEHDFCSECITLCEGCQEYVCKGCIEECPACGDTYCPKCMKMCEECDRWLCIWCHQDDQCPCAEQRRELEGQQQSQKPQESQKTVESSTTGELS